MELEFHYQLVPIGTEAHHQNGFIERSIFIVDVPIAAMLLGLGLPMAAWPSAFYQFLWIKNAALPRRGATMSSDDEVNGAKTNLSDIRVFGCPTHVRHSGKKRRGKYKIETKMGRYLGHKPGTSLKNAIWIDSSTQHIKYGYHQRFDEGMNDLTLSEMLMNEKMFHRHSLDLDLYGLVSEVNDGNMTFYMTDSPFKLEHTFTVKIR